MARIENTLVTGYGVTVGKCGCNLCWYRTGMKICRLNGNLGSEQEHAGRSRETEN